MAGGIVQTIFTGIITICPWVMRMAQLAAIYSLFYNYIGWNLIVSVIVGFILSCVPVVGPVCGIAGAMYAWEWAWWQSVLLFAWYPIFALFIGLVFGVGSPLVLRFFDYIKELFSGKKPLWLTFWIYGIFVVFVFEFIIVAIRSYYIQSLGNMHV